MDEKKQIKIFVSYSSKDRELMKQLKEGLQEHLSQHPLVSFKVWSDKEINIGSKWKEEIEKSLAESQAGVLLVSASFASSEFINREELSQFFSKKKEEGFTLIPILARTYQFENFESLSSLQFFKTYYSDFGFTDLSLKHKIMPFDELVDVDNPSEKKLSKYYDNLAREILKAFKI